ncbi:hypothetical protein ABZP36_021167 [Zizania latifolia]
MPRGAPAHMVQKEANPSFPPGAEGSKPWFRTTTSAAAALPPRRLLHVSSTAAQSANHHLMARDFVGGHGEYKCKGLVLRGTRVARAAAASGCEDGRDLMDGYS